MSDFADPTALAVDHAKVKALVEKLSPPIRAHLDEGEPSRAKVFEALNALASCAAVIIVGTGVDEEAIGFFADALAQQTESTLTDELLAGIQGEKP